MSAKGKLKVFKIDHDANSQLVKKYKAYSLPTLIFSNMDKVGIKIVVGYSGLKLFLSAELRAHLPSFNVERRKVNITCHEDPVAMEASATGKSHPVTTEECAVGKS